MLVETLARRLVTDTGPYFIFADGSRMFKNGAPPLIGNARPDIFGRHQDTKRPIIGEAKTMSDIVSPHTEQQLRSYFTYLQNDGAGKLFLAVPWAGLDQMYFIAKRIRRLVKAEDVQYTVFGWPVPNTDFCIERHG